MASRLRLVAAMSGGVDSAVAAARAVDAGHEVTGVHLALVQGTHSGCCTPEDARDARRAADTLGIPYYVWDFARQFAESVVEDFASTYSSGETPNPCLRCNERIKFTAVLDRALALGFDGVITGHYARLADGVLRRSADLGKDQSYVLGTLTPRQLATAHFPLGPSQKSDVRREAAARGLAVAEKPDSHDVCFVGPGGTGDWLRDRLGVTPGPIVDEAGTVLGEHEGSFAYTVGQRRGLPLGGGTVNPRYVLSVSPVTNTVVVGPAASLDVLTVHCRESSYDGPARDCEVQVRAHGEPVKAHVTPDAAGGLEVLLESPIRGVAPGQAVILYEPDLDGDIVLGGARVAGTAPSWPSSHSLTASP